MLRLSASIRFVIDISIVLFFLSFIIPCFSSLALPPAVFRIGDFATGVMRVSVCVCVAVWRSRRCMQRIRIANEIHPTCTRHAACTLRRNQSFAATIAHAYTQLTHTRTHTHIHSHTGAKLYKTTNNRVDRCCLPLCARIHFPSLHACVCVRAL